MDLNDDKGKVEENAIQENTNTSTESVEEHNDSNNTSVTPVSLSNDENVRLDAAANAELNSNATQSQVARAENNAVLGESSATENKPVTDCCSAIPRSANSERSDRDRYVGILQNRDSVNGLPKSEDQNAPSSRHIVTRDLGDVTLNLNEFLSYAQRNNYNIVIPASRENQVLNTNLPRIGTGCRYMVLEQPNLSRNLGTATDATYPTTEFINISSCPARRSVLAPNVYDSMEELQPPAVDFNAPPPYESPSKLPTYEEVQREKAMEGELVPPNTDAPNSETNPPHALSFLAVDTEMGSNNDPDSNLLGTDFMFVMSFFIAFIFNWIGFLLLMCFCHTIASRYGALSGFGLSLAKWTIIMRSSTDVTVQNSWLWWLITAFGIMICVRALFQYNAIKRGWRFMTASAQERLLFFY